MIVKHLLEQGYVVYSTGKQAAPLRCQAQQECYLVTCCLAAPAGLFGAAAALLWGSVAAPLLQLPSLPPALLSLLLIHSLPAPTCPCLPVRACLQTATWRLW
jgi:hypothetical protein